MVINVVYTFHVDARQFFKADMAFLFACPNRRGGLLRHSGFPPRQLTGATRPGSCRHKHMCFAYTDMYVRTYVRTYGMCVVYSTQNTCVYTYIDVKHLFIVYIYNVYLYYKHALSIVLQKALSMPRLDENCGAEIQT